MLKALELIGFKSFADKTRFEFDHGITAVVGPNGSGKSNVVDGIKWVLGEQSPKSLRGKEMTDCIFNGSGSRKCVNMAEVTLTFDNSNGKLPLDTPEVHISRRVYRSGESEYLINRQPARLRDIRELFMGTGMGTNAYCVIEQGRVDALLQASPKDRRQIFEEAAGISRFRAKKMETLRRLERVDQNLLRLADIVTEVENQLKTVRQQASRAKRYQEHNDRLQQLRTQISLVEYRKHTQRLQELESELVQLRQQIDEQQAAADALDSQHQAEEKNFQQADERVRQAERNLAENLQRISGSWTSIDHQRSRCLELEEEVTRLRRQLASLSIRSGDLQHQLVTTAQAVAEADTRQKAGMAKLIEDEQALQSLQAQIDALRSDIELQQATLRSQMREASRFTGDIRSLESQVAAAEERANRIVGRLESLLASHRDLETLQTTLRGQELTLQQAVDREIQAMSVVQQRLNERRRARTQLHGTLSQLRGKLTGACERQALLEELEQRHEGLSPGVRQVLQSAKREPEGLFASVRGLVADLFQVNIDTAPLIEVALGELAVYVVVSSTEQLYHQLAKANLPLSGRVGFVPLDVPDSSPPVVDLEGERGVIGRADRFVETPDDLRALAERLLGNTWIVETLPQALRLARHFAPWASHAAALQPAGLPRGLEFVTLAGELLRPDGTLLAGPRSNNLGLISRKSELRDLARQQADLEQQIASRQAELEQLETQIDQDKLELESLTSQRQKALDALAEHRGRLAEVESRLAQFAENRRSLEQELSSAQTAQTEAQSAVEKTREQLLSAESQVTELEQVLNRTVESLDDFEQQRAELSARITHSKVVLAKSEERWEALRSSMFQLQRDQDERRQSIADSQQHLSSACERLQTAELSILQTEAELALLYLEKQELAVSSLAALQHRDSIRRLRSQLVGQSQSIRNAVRQLQDHLHRQDLKAGEARHRRQSLIDKMQEDYGIDLMQAATQPAALSPEQVQAGRLELLTEDADAVVVEREIEDLRKKIRSIGNVNLDALQELDELETRFAHLDSQYQDLKAAKESLEQIIAKINVDSRRLFVETLETVRGHFQELFRKVFGGGHGDIILEEGQDILETGIDIVARPPGKELRNISLLSGGEKTMTCVALLLAIFRNRPSPFCVLDEVDAALDEANVGRFTAVLQEFLQWTQFIVVTHSKKTMTCATTLYGVTMQESGVSKRVSVRFEDVTEDGHIRVNETDNQQAA